MLFRSTLAEYLENADKGNKVTGPDGKERTVCYYATDLQQQSQYINMFKEAGKDAFVLTQNIDQPFVTQLEYINEEVKFQRIDAELTQDFKETIGEDELKDEIDSLTEIFRRVLNKANEKCTPDGILVGL